MAEANPPETESVHNEPITPENPKEKRPKIDDETARNRALCINVQCQSGAGITSAPVFVQTFYNVRYEKNVVQRVCDDCYMAAEDHFVKLREQFVNDESLIEMGCSNLASNSVILDGSEETRPEDRLPDNVVQVLKEHFNDIFSEALEKNNFTVHLDKAVEMCSKKLVKVEAGIPEMSQVWTQVQKEVDDLRKKFYEPFIPERKFLTPYEIKEEFGESPLCGNFKVKQSVPPPRTLVKLLPPTCVIPSEMDVQQVKEVYNEGRIRPIGALVIPQLHRGAPVIACRTPNITNHWERGKIFAIDTGSTPYRVRFGEGQIKSLSERCVAHGMPSSTAYQVGNRVVAYFRSLDGMRKSGFYVGVIGEPAKSINNYRCLIFFDAGFPQYIDHDDIYPVKKGPPTADDLDQHSRTFILKYLNRYPERPMVRLQVGQDIHIQVGFTWYRGIVRNIDASLAKIAYGNKSEWMYRGSERLKPLYDQNRRRHGVPQSVLKHTNRPYVYWNTEDGEPAASSESPKGSRMVAKKSMRPNTSAQRLTPRLQPSEIVEFKTAGCLRPVVFQKRVIGRTFVAHKCGPDCVSWTNYQECRGRKMAPLVIPLQVGFDRFVHRIKKKVVFVTYSTPCGRMIRNYEEMHRYLMTTRCFLGIDLFTFEGEIRVGDEFSVPRGLCKYFVEDVSGGAENVEIQCINEISEQKPEPLIYSTVRLPLEGVNINTSPEFRVCCDCTDDCSDKAKCACWQLTLSAPESIKKLAGESSFGYSNRRLEQPVSTGIYECYTGCSCIKSMCTNRVVQFPLTQKLQLFRTLNKGWGLRTLNDIPSGALVCIYVGLLMNESRANEDGRKYGDEYFAQIDFIENAEQIKEDYERGVDLDPEASYEDSDQEQKDLESDKEFIPGVPITGLNRSVNTRSKKKKNQGDEEENPQSTFTANEPAESKTPSVRELFGPNEDCYVMDAKKKGNIGRYLNHSCDPNTVVQNVFIDTHDPRFPWVAFFAAKNLKAGTELTWDYGYTLREDGERRMYCYCGTSQCRQYLM